MISDFIGKDFEDELKLANRKHDIVALQIYDQRENELPDAGIIHLKNAETDELLEVDSSNANVRKKFNQLSLQKEKSLNDVFAKSGVDWIKLRTDENYVHQLMRLFKKRGRK